MKIEELYAITPDANGWRILPNGNEVKLGDGVILGNWVTLGNEVTLGNGVILGNEVKLGNGVILGNWVTLGDGVTLGDEVTLGDGVTLGNGVKLGNEVTLKESPLQIQGSRHFLYLIGDKLTIGCHEYSVKEWLAHYKEIGAKRRYTPAQIEEYGEYIRLAAKRVEYIVAIAV